MGRAQLRGRLQLAVVDVDRDDLRRTRQVRPGDRRGPDTTAADDGDRVAPSDVPGVDGRADARHHSASQQTGGGRRRGRVDLGALPGGDQRLLREGADAQGRGQLGAVGQGHLLLRVVGGEAVPRPSAQTGPALPAHGTPVEDDEVAGREVGDALPHRLHDTRGLVAQQEREVVVDAALAIVQIGVAHPAGLDLHQRLTGARVGHDDRFQADGGALAPRDDSTDLVRHGHSSTDGDSNRMLLITARISLVATQHD